MSSPNFLATFPLICMLVLSGREVLPGVRDAPLDRSGRCHGGGAKVDERLGGAHPTLVVAVARAQAPVAGAEYPHVLPEARAAVRGLDVRACVGEDLQESVVHRPVVDAPAGGDDEEVGVRADLPPLEYLGCDRQ